MTRFLTASVTLVFIFSALPSCVDSAEQKPMGPTTETSKIPWNSQIPGQGQGQFGMLPQNQYRR